MTPTTTELASTTTPDIEIFRHAQNIVTSRRYARAQTPFRPLRPSQFSLFPTSLQVGPRKRIRRGGKNDHTEVVGKQESDEVSDEEVEEDLSGLTPEEIQTRRECAWARGLDGPLRGHIQPFTIRPSNSKAPSSPVVKSTRQTRDGDDDDDDVEIADDSTPTRTPSHSRRTPSTLAPLECIGSASKLHQKLLAGSELARSDPNETLPSTSTSASTSISTSNRSKKRKRASTSPPLDSPPGSPLISASAPVGGIGQGLGSSPNASDGMKVRPSLSQPLPARPASSDTEEEDEFEVESDLLPLETPRPAILPTTTTTNVGMNMGVGVGVDMEEDELKTPYGTPVGTPVVPRATPALNTISSLSSISSSGKRRGDHEGGSASASASASGGKKKKPRTKNQFGGTGVLGSFMTDSHKDKVDSDNHDDKKNDDDDDDDDDSGNEGQTTPSRRRRQMKSTTIGTSPVSSSYQAPGSPSPASGRGEGTTRRSGRGQGLGLGRRGDSGGERVTSGLRNEVVPTIEFQVDDQLLVTT